MQSPRHGGGLAPRCDLLTARDPRSDSRGRDAIRTASVAVEVTAALRPSDGVRRSPPLRARYISSTMPALSPNARREIELASWRGGDLKCSYMRADARDLSAHGEARHGGRPNLIGMPRAAIVVLIWAHRQRGALHFTKALGADSSIAGARARGQSGNRDRPLRNKRSRVPRRTRDKTRWRDSRQTAAHRSRVREISDVTVFLVSDRASFVSGTVITVDGGMASRPMPL